MWVFSNSMSQLHGVAQLAFIIIVFSSIHVGECVFVFVWLLQRGTDSYQLYRVIWGVVFRTLYIHIWYGCYESAPYIGVCWVFVDKYTYIHIYHTYIYKVRYTIHTYIVLSAVYGADVDVSAPKWHAHRAPLLSHRRR